MLTAYNRISIFRDVEKSEVGKRRIKRMREKKESNEENQKNEGTIARMSKEPKEHKKKLFVLKFVPQIEFQLLLHSIQLLASQQHER